MEKSKNNLSVRLGAENPNTESRNPILGRITFDPLEILVYKQVRVNRGQERFTIAHELAHYFLKHGQYLRMESCDEQDFQEHQKLLSDGSDIARLEFQANFFAACMLMPRTNMIKDFSWLIKRLNIPNKGFGALYVDNQPCNLRTYEQVTNALIQHYGVSRTAVTNRLVELELLRDARTKQNSSSQAFHSVLSGSM